MGTVVNSHVTITTGLLPDGGGGTRAGLSLVSFTYRRNSLTFIRVLLSKIRYRVNSTYYYNSMYHCIPSLNDSIYDCGLLNDVQ